MPFVKDDPNINKLDTLPEKFTKEFVDYVTQMKKLITEERARCFSRISNMGVDTNRNKHYSDSAHVRSLISL